MEKGTTRFKIRESKAGTGFVMINEVQDQNVRRLQRANVFQLRIVHKEISRANNPTDPNKSVRSIHPDADFAVWKRRRRELAVLIGPLSHEFALYQDGILFAIKASKCDNILLTRLRTLLDLPPGFPSFHSEVTEYENS